MAGARSQAPRQEIGSSVNRLSSVVSPKAMPSLLFRQIEQGIISHDPAADAVANKDHMPATGCLKMKL